MTTILVGDHYEVRTDGDGETTRETYFAGGRPVAVRELPSGTLFWLITDHLGSLMAAADASGTLTAELRYAAFGVPRYTAGVLPTAHQYTFQRAEPLLGLYDYRARWYDPGAGRFAQADTIVPAAGSAMAWDRYAYVTNSPLRFADPTGHRICEELDVCEPPHQTPGKPTRVDPMYEIKDSGYDFGQSHGCPALPAYEGRSGCIHPGVDVKSNYRGIVAPAAGDVFFMTMTNAAGELTGFGNYIVLRVRGSDAVVYYHILAHLASNNEYRLQQGQRVAAGTRLGVMGNSGTDAIHLHWEIRTDPTGDLYGDVDYSEHNRPLKLDNYLPTLIRGDDMFYPREEKILNRYWVNPLSWATTSWYGPYNPVRP